MTPGHCLRAVVAARASPPRISETEVHLAILISGHLLEILVIAQRLEGERSKILTQGVRIHGGDRHAGTTRIRHVHKVLHSEAGRVGAGKKISPWLEVW